MSDKIFTDNILQGKVAFVTGGGTGITGGVARALAEAGAKVAITSRKIENLEAAAKIINDNGGECFPVVCDVRDFEASEPNGQAHNRPQELLNLVGGTFLEIPA